MAYRIESTNLLKRTLESYLDSPEFYSKNTIKKLLTELDNFKKIIEINPFVGQIEPDTEIIDYEIRRLVIKPYFKVVYTHRYDTVFLIDIWDTRQDPKNLISRLGDWS